ncbi:MAG TPA: hypothetical protein VHI71_10925 [Actinomycetota bacterium]|nr:hypothetical protein [Actinomycetota bacterium]
MHPTILGQVAHDHVDTLIARADAARLARVALEARPPRPRLRRRVGLRLISLGERLAPECPQNVIHLPGGRS